MILPTKYDRVSTLNGMSFSIDGVKRIILLFFCERPLLKDIPLSIFKDAIEYILFSDSFIVIVAIYTPLLNK